MLDLTPILKITYLYLKCCIFVIHTTMFGKMIKIIFILLLPVKPTAAAAAAIIHNIEACSRIQKMCKLYNYLSHRISSIQTPVTQSR